MKNYAGLLIIFFSFLSGYAVAQPTYNKQYLQEQNLKLQSELAELNRSLQRSRSESKTSVTYARNLNEKIKKQRKLLSNIRKEKRFIEDEIYLTQLEINKLNRELGELRKDFKEILVKAYKNKSVQNKLLFVLSSKSFTQAYRRIKYLEKYSDYQLEKADEIREKQTEILKKKAAREASKIEKEELLVRQQVFADEMQSELKEKEAIVNEFKKNEGKIRRQIAKKSREQKAIKSQIRKIIQEEIRLAKQREEEERKRREAAERERQAELARAAKAAEDARKKAEAEKAKNAAANETKVAVNETKPKESASKPAETANKTIKTKTQPTPALKDRSSDEILTGNFANNKGRLPWPVSKGTIVGFFGTHPHPILKGITEDNDGIDIATSKGAKAKAVFDGEVSSVISIPGSNKGVLVRHGNYFTLYHNLATVNVSKGQKVKKGASLGTIFTDLEGQTLLNFQVWKVSNKQNPQDWLRN